MKARAPQNAIVQKLANFLVNGKNNKQFRLFIGHTVSAELVNFAFLV